MTPSPIINLKIIYIGGSNPHRELLTVNKIYNADTEDSHGYWIKRDDGWDYYLLKEHCKILWVKRDEIINSIIM